MRPERDRHDPSVGRAAGRARAARRVPLRAHRRPAHGRKLADRLNGVPRAPEALALNCTLKSSPDESSTGVCCPSCARQLEEHGVRRPTVRVADHDVKPGVTSDEGDGDEWPAIRRQILDADILVLATPIWLGHPSSMCQRVLERLDAFLGEEDDQGRMITSTASRDRRRGRQRGRRPPRRCRALPGASSTSASRSRPTAQVYWVGEAMGSVDYKDLDKPPEKVAQTTEDVARHAAHLARVLAASPYPPG